MIEWHEAWVNAPLKQSLFLAMWGAFVLFGALVKWGTELLFWGFDAEAKEREKS